MSNNVWLFARLLLHKPNVAFLDEATASMDEGLEDNMYRLLKERLPNITVISVGHRQLYKLPSATIDDLR